MTSESVAMELTVMELRLGICTKALVHAGSTALSSSPRSDPLGGNPFRFQFQWFDLYLWLRCVFLNVYVYLNLGNTIWSIDWQPQSLQKSHVISLSLSYVHILERPALLRNAIRLSNLLRFQRFLDFLAEQLMQKTENVSASRSKFVLRFGWRWLLAFMIVKHLPRLLQMPTWMLLLVGDKLGLGRQGSFPNSPPFKHIHLSKDIQPPLGACCWSWNDCCWAPQNVKWS